MRKNSSFLIKKMFPLLFLVLILTFTVSSVSATVDTIYVNDTGGNDDNDGSNWTQAKKTIKNATESLNENGIMNIANGNYNGTNNTRITLNKNMTINGESQTDTVINGTNNNWIFNINAGISITLNNLSLYNAHRDIGGVIYNHNGNLTLNNITLANNNVTLNGGAILSEQGNISMNNVTFTNNTAAYDGGAIYNYNSNLTLNNTIFNDNIANQGVGGAIYAYEYSNLCLNNTLFINNTARSSGAIYNQKSNLTINNTLFTNNIANTNPAGAIYNSYSNLTINNTSFTNNTAIYYGGAIYNYNSDLTINNTLFTNNSATQSGGAIYNIYSNLTLNTSSFTNNTAMSSGGAIYNTNSNITVIFCRIVGNSYPDIYTESSGNLDYNWWGTNFKETDPVTDGRVAGATVSKWLVLSITANPTIINNGKTSTITADLLHDQNGDQSSGTLLDGILVTFNTNLGSVGSKTVNKTIINGAATATLTADETGGIAHINAVVDSQTVETNVNIKTNTITITENKKNVAGQNIILTAIVKDDMGLNVTGGQVKFTVNGINVGTVNVVNGLATLNWQIPSNWALGTYEIDSQYNGTDIYLTSQSKANLTIDIKPTAKANVKSGLYNVNKKVYLSLNKAGNIYYTLNGATPTSSSTKYTGYITITSTKTLKFIAIDQDGNKSPIYTEKYVIDKTAPKVSYTYPKNLKTKQSRTTTLYLKFNENIKKSTYWSKIYVKDLKTGKKVSISKWIKGRTLYIKTKYKRASLRWYRVYVPYKAVKDYAGNNLAKTYTFKFKTRS